MVFTQKYCHQVHHLSPTLIPALPVSSLLLPVAQAKLHQQRGDLDAAEQLYRTNLARLDQEAALAGEQEVE
jgi:hypothetical protein